MLFRASVFVLCIWLTAYRTAASVHEESPATAAGADAAEMRKELLRLELEIARLTLPRIQSSLRGPSVIVRRSGAVSEPPSGEFDAVVSPGQSLVPIIEVLPPGSAVLLLEGDHILRETLVISKEVHIFGSRAATIVLPNNTPGDVVSFAAGTARSPA